MKLICALFAAVLVCAPLSAQEEPKVERKEVRTSKVIKIENGKVTELQGEDAEAEIAKMRAEVERLRKEVEDRLKGVRPRAEREWQEPGDGLEDDMGDMLRGLPEEMRKRVQDALRRARGAADKAKNADGDVDIEIDESSEDGSSRVKIRIVRKTVRGGQAAPEAPAEKERKQ